MTDPKVFLLDGGTLVIDASDVHWHIDAGTPVRFPVYSVLVETPSALILYDTGYDLDHVNKVLPFELPEQTPEQTIPAQLALCGYTPEDVDIVVNSHFHFDHVGGNKYLTKATTLVHTAELRQAKVPEPFERYGYSDLSFDHPEVTYQPISGDYEIAPGVTLFETPGHTIGHYSMLVEMANEKSMLFCGDAAYTRTTLANEWIAGFHLDPAKSVQSIRRLNYLGRIKEADIYPSHELEPYLTWKLAPAYYGGS
ncbi:4-pyridoxolactonase [Gryllotalpicola koreensis]|uniref:4-pyridoxolactonase n=1 Tax=Gryllotalpicola koreensis TaxID=993086 RepID=A0ABP7ZR31_9MICO